MTHASDQPLPPAVLAPLSRIDAELRACTDGMALADSLRDAVLYALTGPGKRLRPLLVWHSCAACGGDPAASLPSVLALELIHCFSLVHDDLPGLDNDDMRRGRPTLHKHTSVAMGVLAGDEMLTLAFRMLAERVTDRSLVGTLVGELSSATSDMIVGQVYDTLGGLPPDATPRAKLELVHRNKTGALIRAACRMGAMHAASGETDAGRRNRMLSAITTYAESIGLMFQIVDDLLDVTQSSEHLGKKSGKDIDAGKLTYPGLLGEAASRAEVRKLHDLANASLAPLGPAAEPLRQLASYMAVRTR
jgi:geranylgeranyl diphosphate synthase type II